MAAKRAFVTGAGSGIGRATALELTKRGYQVTAADVIADRLSDLAVDSTVCLDVTSDSSVSQAVAANTAIDVLVNAAGIGLHGPVEKTPLEDIRRLFEVNFYGPVRLLQAFLPAMRERASGTIVNVGSGAGRHPGVLTGAYSATKAALDIITESLAHEVGPFGIRVLMALPGAVRTNFAGSRTYAGLDEPPYDDLASRKRRVDNQLLAHGEEPEEFATVIADAIEDGGKQFRYGSFQPGDDIYHQRHIELRRTLGYDD